MSFFFRTLNFLLLSVKRGTKNSNLRYCVKFFLNKKKKFKLGNIQLGTRLINHVSDLVMYAIINYEKNIISSSGGNQKNINITSQRETKFWNKCC